MTKYLLLIGLVVAVWWFWRESQKTRTGKSRQDFKGETERMVECAHCGVNQPVSESILASGRYYCCAGHLPAGESDGR